MERSVSHFNDRMFSILLLLIFTLHPSVASPIPFEWHLPIDLSQMEKLISQYYTSQ